MGFEDFPLIRALGFALLLSTGCELIQFIRNWRKNQNDETDDSEPLDVVFFPDLTVACEAHFSYGCNNAECWHSHEETSTMKVSRFIETARKSIDVCVYCITSDALVGSILKAHQEGVIVRILTDQAQAADHEAPLGRLRSSG